jgi:3-methylcrotonyl-CoA carboxylase beta subunit
VLSTVKADGMEARGESWDKKERLNYERRIKRQYEKQGHPYYASARLWDDGVIDPVDTRGVLGQAISASLNNPRDDEMPHGIFRM